MTTFQGLPSLVFLDISSNKIGKIAKHSFREQTHLRLLNVRDNKLKVIEVMAFAGLKSISILDISMQDISQIEGLLVNISSTLDLLNVSSNSIELLNTDAFSDLPTLATIDIRRNPITRVNIMNVNNLTNLNILTDISYLCCFNIMHTCDKKLLGICPFDHAMASVSYLGIMTIILNILHYGRKRKYCRVRTTMILFSLQVLCNCLMGISVIIPLLKDKLFPPQIVHQQQGIKYMYCFLSGTFQLFLILFLSCLAVFNSVNTYNGTLSMVRESSDQRKRKFVCLFIISVLSLLLCCLPALVIFITHELLPNVSGLCSLFNALNSDSCGTLVSIGIILCLVIANSISQIVVSCKTLKSVHHSQEVVKGLGGLISSTQYKHVLIFKCLIQPVTTALLQIAAGTICLMDLLNMVTNKREDIRTILILLPSTIQAILGNIK